MFDYDGVNDALRKINQTLDEFSDRLRLRGFDKFKKRYFVEARYRFQVWELEVEIESGYFANENDVTALVEAFHKMHDRVFAITDVGQVVECLNWRGRLTADVNAPSLEPGKAGGDEMVREDRRRLAYFGAAPIKTPIYLGQNLNVGALVSGPAIIEEPTSTLVINPGSTVKVSAGGRYILTPSEQGLI
jgi:N-methylhydantoinase A